MVGGNGFPFFLFQEKVRREVVFSIYLLFPPLLLLLLFSLRVILIKSRAACVSFDFIVGTTFSDLTSALLLWKLVIEIFRNREIDDRV